LVQLNGENSQNRAICSASVHAANMVVILGRYFGEKLRVRHHKKFTKNFD